MRLITVHMTLQHCQVSQLDPVTPVMVWLNCRLKINFFRKLTNRWCSFDALMTNLYLLRYYCRFTVWLFVIANCSNIIITTTTTALILLLLLLILLINMINIININNKCYVNGHYYYYFHYYHLLQERWKSYCIRCVLKSQLINCVSRVNSFRLIFDLRYKL
jgi:hypothetical protein